MLFNTFTLLLPYYISIIMQLLMLIVQYFELNGVMTVMNFHIS